MFFENRQYSVNLSVTFFVCEITQVNVNSVIEFLCQNFMQA